MTRVGRGLLALALASAGAVAATAAAAPATALETRAERGPVHATVRIHPTAPRIGDPVTLELEVRAEPGVELLMPAFGEALDRFAIVDFVPAEALADDGGTLARQRYTLQPMRSGPQAIPPLAIEFVDRRPGRPAAPEGEDAFELLTEPLEFEVQAVLPEDAPLELRALLGELPARELPGRGRWPLVAGTLVLLALLAPLAWRAWQRHRTHAARRSAYQIARSALDALLAAPLPRAERMDAFYVSLSSIVRRYLEDRFGLRSPELTTQEFLSVLVRSPDLTREHQELLARFLELADLVKFAHHVPERGDVAESVRAAERFLEETRDDREAPPPQPLRAGESRV